MNSSQVTVVLERITHWHPIDYNGNLGTEVYLDTGKSLRVGEYHEWLSQAPWGAYGTDPGGSQRHRSAAEEDRAITTSTALG